MYPGYLFIASRYDRVTKSYDPTHINQKMKIRQSIKTLYKMKDARKPRLNSLELWKYEEN